MGGPSGSTRGSGVAGRCGGVEAASGCLRAEKNVILPPHPPLASLLRSHSLAQTGNPVTSPCRGPFAHGSPPFAALCRHGEQPCPTASIRRRLPRYPTDLLGHPREGSNFGTPGCRDTAAVWGVCREGVCGCRRGGLKCSASGWSHSCGVSLLGCPARRIARDVWCEECI